MLGWAVFSSPRLLRAPPAPAVPRAGGQSPAGRGVSSFLQSLFLLSPAANRHGEVKTPCPEHSLLAAGGRDVPQNALALGWWQLGGAGDGGRSCTDAGHKGNKMFSQRGKLLRCRPGCKTFLLPGGPHSGISFHLQDLLTIPAVAAPRVPLGILQRKGYAGTGAEPR